MVVFSFVGFNVAAVQVLHQIFSQFSLSMEKSRFAHRYFAHYFLSFSYRRTLFIRFTCRIDFIVAFKNMQFVLRYFSSFSCSSLILILSHSSFIFRSFKQRFVFSFIRNRLFIHTFIFFSRLFFLSFLICFVQVDDDDDDDIDGGRKELPCICFLFLSFIQYSIKQHKGISEEKKKTLIT